MYRRKMDPINLIALIAHQTTIIRYEEEFRE
jgi:hypothetical protein